jgi:hypothetical protein
MKLCKNLLIAACVLSIAKPTAASGSFEEAYSDRLYEKQFEKRPMHHGNDYQDSPFYLGVKREGRRTDKLTRNLSKGQIAPYNATMDVRPVELDNEIAIVRTSTTNVGMVKTCYDKKGNIVSITAWDRRTGKDVNVNLDVLSEPIVKDEIESSVAKLRIVYNAYGEVISKAAWNKITGEKIGVPAAVPFTNYISEDKYWAYIERQKLYDRSYEDLYVDRGSVRTKRMKKLVRYGNPFGVPEEVVVYEERPIVERHYEDVSYAVDGFVAMHSASMGGTISGRNQSSTIKDSSSTYLEVGVDLDLFGRQIQTTLTSQSNDSTLLSAVNNFDGRNFAAGSKFSWDLTMLDFTFRRKFIRSERGDFGINWLFTLALADIDLSLTNGNIKTSIEGSTLLPKVGFEIVKNVNDHFDFNGSLQLFSMGGVTLSQAYFGGKYYFHPEDVDDWRASLGYKMFALEAEDGSDSVDIDHSGIRLALERSF